MTTAPTNDDDPLQMLTVPKVAKLLQMSERQVHREIKAGKLSVHHFGRAVRVLRADLMTYVAARRGEKSPSG